MSLRVLVACEDAGAAAAIAPVCEVLRAGGASLTGWLGEVAARSFGGAVAGRRLAEPSALEEAVASGELAAVDVLLAGTSAWGLRLEARAALEARRRGIPSVGVLDFWSNYAARLSFPGETGLAATPDVLAAVDTTMRDELLALGLAPGRVVVTGSPAFDPWLEGARAPRDRDVARSVLFLSQPLRALYGDALGYDEVRVLDETARVAAALGAPLIVRPHPREDASELAARAAASPGHVSLSAAPDLREDLAHARVVVGMTTMALVHAALAGVPAVSAQLGRRGEDPLATNRVGLTIPATTSEALAAEVRAAYEGRTAGAGLPAGWAPGAAARVADLVRQTARLEERAR